MERRHGHRATERLDEAEAPPASAESRGPRRTDQDRNPAPPRAAPGKHHAQLAGAGC